MRCHKYFGGGNVLHYDAFLQHHYGSAAPGPKPSIIASLVSSNLI